MKLLIMQSTHGHGTVCYHTKSMPRNFPPNTSKLEEEETTCRAKGSTSVSSDMHNSP